LFEGLSHNPEAATNAFESKADLDHMLGTTVYTDRGESLGRALEAATTGASAGDTTQQAPPHSETQVRIMKNIMETVAQPGGGAALVSKGLGDSFGNMAASYMPEISQTLAGHGAEPIFLTNSDDPDGLEEVRDVVRFLSAVSTDPDGRAGIVLGESIYTSTLLEAHLTDPALFDGSQEQVLTDIGKNAGTIEGIVAHSLADDEVRAAVKGETEYNNALKAKGDFAKTWVAIGLANMSVPDAYGGAAMGAVGGGMLGAIAGLAVDRVLEGQQLEGTKDRALYDSAKDFYNSRDSVSQQAQWAAADTIDRNNLDLPKQGTQDLIRDAVNEGYDASDDLLKRTKERP
jgi:hypothetical protein